MADPQEPNRVDIGLSLIDQGSMQVARDLVTELSAVSRQLAEIRAPTSQAEVREARRGVLGRLTNALRSSTASTGAPDAEDAREALGQNQSAGASSAVETEQIQEQQTKALRGAAGQGASRGEDTRAEEVVRRDNQAAIQLTAPTNLGRLREALGHLHQAPRGDKVNTLLDLMPPPPGGSPSDPDHEYISGHPGPRTHTPSNVSLATERELERIREETSDRTEGASRPPEQPKRKPPRKPRQTETAEEAADVDPFGDLPDSEQPRPGRFGNDVPPESQSEAGGTSRGDTENVVPPTPAAFRHLRAMDINEPIQIPRYGEFTVQDKLNMASDWLARGGLRAYDRSDGVEGQGRLQSAALLNQAAAYSPYAMGIGHSLMGKTGILPGSQGPFGININPTQNVQRGVEQGYSRGGADIHPLGFTHVPFLRDWGFQAPGPLRYLTQAGREGLRTEVEQGHLAARAEISNEQAGEIMRAIEQSGWRGDQQRRLTQGAGSLFSLPGMTGLNPQLGVSLMDQTMRYGASSMNQFLETMRNLPEAAKAANVSIDEMGSAMEEMGNAVQEQGGTFGEGMRRATEFSGITGMPAQTGIQAMQNPVVQSNIMLRTGLMPQVQGLAPTGTLTGALSKSLEQMVSVYSSMPDTKIRGPGGVTTVSGRRQAIALAGQQLGLTPEQAMDTWQGRRREEASSQLQEGMEGYIQARADAQHRGPDALRAFQAADDPRSKKFRDRDPQRYNWADLEHMMRGPDMQFSEREIHDIRMAGSPDKQRERLLQAIEKRRPQDVQKNRDHAQIDLTDRAAKWFQVVDESRSDLGRKKRDLDKGHDSGLDYRNAGTNDPRLRPGGLFGNPAGAPGQPSTNGPVISGAPGMQNR